VCADSERVREVFVMDCCKVLPTIQPDGLGKTTVNSVTIIGSLAEIRTIHLPNMVLRNKKSSIPVSR
jgi:hypothetical protein